MQPLRTLARPMLALGWWPRLAASAIAATLVPITVAGHRFWEAQDDQERAQQRIHFLKNAAMLGGLVITAADTAGSPSLAWRGRHAARAARREFRLAARTARLSGRAGATAGRLTGRLPGLGGATPRRPLGVRGQTLRQRASQSP